MVTDTGRIGSADPATRPPSQAPAGLGDTASVRCAFTPGPWLVHATNRLICQADGAFKEVTVENGKAVGDDLPNNICLLRDPGDDFSEDETLANGFLIAAAPDLYDALQRARNTLAGCRMESIAANICDEALAKARGEVSQ